MRPVRARIKPFRRSAAMGACVQRAARANSPGPSGSLRPARTLSTSNCFGGSFSSDSRFAASASTDSSVVMRVPAPPRTPAGTTASSTAAQSQR